MAEWYQDLLIWVIYVLFRTTWSVVLFGVLAGILLQLIIVLSCRWCYSKRRRNEGQMNVEQGNINHGHETEQLPLGNFVWQWMSDDHTHWCNYDLDISRFLEGQCNVGNRTVDLELNFQNMPYVIDLILKTQKRKITGNTGKLRAIRRHVPGSSNDVVQRSLQSLEADNPDYIYVKRIFTTSLNKTILNISQIQNTAHLQFYATRNEQMENTLGEGNANERHLFHGTTGDVVDRISRENFDFRDAGSSAGHVYGYGTYFAIEALTSHRYTGTSNPRKMILARVLCGKYTTGTSELRKPPPLNNTEPDGPAYNSCVDNKDNPTMFVIFDYAQCYPEYIIEYND